MKYLHSGYILFCERAHHTKDGRVDAHGLFDVCVGESLPIQMNCDLVIGFGTPFERRQYNGVVLVENPDGKEVFRKEFQANDPSDAYKGHYILKPDLTLDREGMWTVKVYLRNLKDESIWDLQRQFWAMTGGDTLAGS